MSELDEKALLPCPFCGGERIKSHHIRDGRSLGCQDCGASLRAFNGPTDITDRMVAAWNRRAAPATTVSGDAKEIVDRLRRASGDARRLCLDAAMMIEYLAGKKPHIHPAPTVSGEPVAWLRVRDDGRQTFWERNVDGACTPLYAHPAPDEVRGEDWENAAHAMFWETGQEDLFDRLAAKARQEAAERRALAGEKP